MNKLHTDRLIQLLSKTELMLAELKGKTLHRLNKMEYKIDMILGHIESTRRTEDTETLEARAKPWPESALHGEFKPYTIEFLKKLKLNAIPITPDKLIEKENLTTMSFPRTALRKRRRGEKKSSLRLKKEAKVLKGWLKEDLGKKLPETEEVNTSNPL